VDVIWASKGNNCSDAPGNSNSQSTYVQGVESATYSRFRHKFPHLKVEMVIEVGNHKQTIGALIDTGAEANILQTGLLPRQYWEVAGNPLRFTNANASGMVGGNP